MSMTLARFSFLQSSSPLRVMLLMFIITNFQIKDYFRAKIENPEAYVVKSPKSRLSHLVRLDLGFPLPGRDYHGRRVVWVGLGK